MNGKIVNQLVGDIVRTGPDAARLQQSLAAPINQASENPHWTFYEFELNRGPFAGGEFRQSKAGGRALLSLKARSEPAVTESELDLSQWGEVRAINANPRIQPEGVDAYVYRAGRVNVIFQFTHASRRLRSVALEWGVTEPAASSAGD